MNWLLVAILGIFALVFLLWRFVVQPFHRAWRKYQYRHRKVRLATWTHKGVTALVRREDLEDARKFWGDGVSFMKEGPRVRPVFLFSDTVSGGAISGTLGDLAAIMKDAEVTHESFFVPLSTTGSSCVRFTRDQGTIKARPFSVDEVYKFIYGRSPALYPDEN